MYPGIPTISCLIDYEPSALGSLMAQGPTMLLKNTLWLAVYCERRIRARSPWGVASMERGDSLSSVRSGKGPGLDECAEVHSEAFFKPTVPSEQRVEMQRRQLGALCLLRRPRVKHKGCGLFNHFKHVLHSLKRWSHGIATICQIIN